MREQNRSVSFPCPFFLKLSNQTIPYREQLLPYEKNDRQSISTVVSGLVTLMPIKFM